MKIVRRSGTRHCTGAAAVLTVLLATGSGMAALCQETYEGIDFGLVYVDDVTDYTESDVKQVYLQETKDAQGADVQEIKVMGAGSPRPELRPELTKVLMDAGFDVSKDWSEVRARGGVRVVCRIMDDRAATKLQPEGAATVLLAPILAVFTAGKKEARVVMLIEVYDPANTMLWSDRTKKMAKSGFLGGIWSRKSKLRAKATKLAMKDLAAKFDEWIHVRRGPPAEAKEG